jgi:N-acetylmuramoyl-L-alanine amidase
VVPVSAATQLRQAELTAPAADGARLVLELSAAPASPKVFALTKPARLVIDLPRTSLAKGVKLPPAAGPVRELRDGSRPGGTLRLVLELRQGLAHQTRVEGQKLIVELGRAPAVAATAAPPSTPPALTPVQARHAPQDAGRDVIVAIDAGHGGKDPGALGRTGTQEKQVVLRIAQLLAARINAEPGMRAVLTRSDDRFLDLRERTRLARQARADIFVSIHADANPKSVVSGSSVYVLSEKGASSEAAKWLADQENLKGGISLDRDDPLASVLMDLSQTGTIDDSARAAQRVLSHLDRVGTVRKTQVESAAFAVLKSPDIPSLLVETAFISNPAEEKKLRSPEHQQALADAIFNGVRDYFRQSPPDGTLFARQRADRRNLVTAATP